MHHHHGWDWGRDSLALLRNNHVNFFSFSCWWCISFFRCQQSRAMCQLALWMRKQVYYQIWLCRQGRLELWQGAGVVKLSFYRSNPGERTTVPAGIPYSTQHITHIFHIPHIYSYTNRSSPGERLTGYHKWIQMRKFPAPRKSREIVLCENKILPSSLTASPPTHLNMATIIKVSTLLCNAWTRWRCTYHRTRYENIRWHISYYISHGGVVRLKRSGGHRA